LYQRTAQPDASLLGSSIDMADPAAAKQLIAGFYDLESDAWRWVARSFSVALRRPAGAEKNGAQLTLRFDIPEVQFSYLGPMILSAEINGNALGPERFARSGESVYRRDIPARDMSAAFTWITFTFDKARQPDGKDDRELGAVVKAVGIEKK
jgi:hypothetical protein